MGFTETERKRNGFIWLRREMNLWTQENGESFLTNLRFIRFSRALSMLIYVYTGIDNYLGTAIK
jgi:hypothetical protein